MKKIIFHSDKPYNNKDLQPEPARKNFPSWWKEASLFWKDENGETYISSTDENNNKERGLGFKACPALLDIFSMGYVLKTPVDLMFIQHNDNPYVLVQDDAYKDFCSEREAMGEFSYPSGYHKKHFHWWPNWGVEVPSGYSLLVTNPFNRFDLPFLTVSGIIDSDSHTTPGLMPFFLKEGFSGLVPKGTPFAQIVPIKREDWSSEFVYHTEEEMLNRFNGSADKYRKRFGGVYKKETWSKKVYE